MNARKKRKRKPQQKIVCQLHNKMNARKKRKRKPQQKIVCQLHNKTNARNKRKKTTITKNCQLHNKTMPICLEKNAQSSPRVFTDTRSSRVHKSRAPGRGGH